ncbi:surface protease GP63 [Trypanosoma theileri]|uniref:Leishmanolysin-like peptidase n=1 Tax=Trypanosoma theileri TaxID=67003 RepID=A0A1X0NHD0_9TRYP|nr:surface protease GP63 [Trypanosoma theileri]ORC83908.1 surface protease GP63 [Trypanosoma theileri]
MRRLFLFAPLLLLYCTLVILAVTEHHRCMHDRVVMHVGAYIFSDGSSAAEASPQQEASNPLKRQEPTSGWDPIRIKFFTDDLNTSGRFCSTVDESVFSVKSSLTCTTDDVLTPEKEEILVKKILPEAIKLHSDRLFVERLRGPIVVPTFDSRSLCSKFTIPQEHKTTGVDEADMVLYVAAAPTTDGAFAWAATCATLGPNGRPVVGIINYGPRYIVATPQRVRVAAHEIAHALGFNFPEMERKDMVQIWENGNDQYVVRRVNSSNVLRETKNHYNCDSAEGMELQSVAFVSVPPAKTAAVFALTATVQGEYELGESHSNVMDGLLTGKESVDSDVQERREEEGSNDAKFTQNVHHSSHLLSKRRSIYAQTAMMASQTPSDCVAEKQVKTAKGTECIVEAPIYIPNHKGKMTLSHWSRRNAKDELMVGLVGAGYYTAITMGAFADLGYYKVNWTMAEQMSWGNNSKCEFLNNKCVNSGETKFSNMFCTTKSSKGTESLRCTSDRQSLGTCSSIEAKPVEKDLPARFQYFSDDKKVGSDSSEQMDYCPFIKALPQKSCISGERNQMPGSVIANNSRCVEGNGLTANNAAVGAVCVEVSCKFNKVIVRYSGNDEWYSCPEGKNLTVDGTVLQGKIVCPKYADVCNTINKTLDESQGPEKDPDTVEAIQTSQPEATGTARPTENDGNQEVTAPVVQNEASTTTEANRSETKEENNTSSVSGQNNNATAKKGPDGSFKASSFASVMFVFLTLSVIMLP